MKYILLLSMIVCGYVGKGQHACDSGYSYMPSMSTSSLRIKADTCLPDSTCKRLWKRFYENMCGETGFGSFYLGKETKRHIPLSYSDSHTWNDSIGCITKETWRKMAKGKWLDITKAEYDKINIWNSKQRKKKK